MPGRFAAALAVLLAIAPSASPQEDADRAPRTEADRRILADASEIEAEVARLRERPFTAPVAKQVYTRDQLAGFLAGQFDDPENQADLEREERQLRAFGFLPADVSLRELLEGLLTSQIAGFYDPKDRTLRCITSDVALVQRVTMVHEIYHSLQDQYVPLEAYMKGEKSPAASDMARARQAVVEGDAQFFTMNVYVPEHRETVASDLTAQSPGELLGFGIGQALAQAAIPPYFADELTWPYLMGARFVAALHAEGGWTAVDRAFVAPPVSTEQLLHPRKYLDGSDPPLAVTARAPPFAKDWKELQRDTLGEAEIAALLLHLGRDAVHSARGSEGWGGDQLLLLEAPDGATLLVWRLRFDTERDGEQFYSAWRRLLTKSYETSEATPAAPLVAELASGAAGFAVVAPRDAELPARLRAALKSPAGVSFCVAEQAGVPSSWLVRRGADVLLLRGPALGARPLTDLLPLDQELNQ